MTTLQAPAQLPLLTEARAKAPRAYGRLFALTVVASLLGLVYLLGFLQPLSYRRFPGIIPSERPLADVLGTDLGGALRFLIPVVVASVLYGAAVVLARGLHGRRLALAVLGVAGVYVAIFLPTNPVGAQDIYHNVFDGRILWRYHDNPNVVPPAAYPDDPLYPTVVAWSEFASPYGPLWYAATGIPYAIAGDDLRANVLGHKALTAFFLLTTGILAYLVAERLRAGSGVAALIAVTWNPLMLFETAGNGHNDIVMVCFALAAFWALAARRWLLVFPLLALSVATKYGFVILGPLILVYMLHRQDVRKRTIVLSLLLGALVGIAVYIPFFQGAETLEMLRRQSVFNTSSPAALLDAALVTRLGMTPEDSSALMKLIVMPLYLLAYAWLVWLVWRGRGGLDTLVRQSVTAVFLLLLIATWWFWPWYVIWIVPLAALVPYRRAALLGLSFSCAALAMYAAYFWLLFGDGLFLQAATSAVAFGPPLVLLAGSLVWTWPRARRALPHAVALDGGVA